MVLRVVIFLCLSIQAYAFDHNHRLWNEILQKHTKMQKRQVLVNYKGIKQDPTNLNDYLKKLSGVRKTEFKRWSSDERLAFLINAYNAFTVKLVVDNYPVNSIKEIAPWYTNPWKMTFIDLLGEEVHLDHIEHVLIRENFDEPRIHFAVNCASLGCPSLFQKAFIGEKLDRQLEAATKHFILNNHKNDFDNKSGKLLVSRVFKWYSEDFEKSHTTIEKFIRKYIAISEEKEIGLEYLDYNWSLNDYE